MKKIKYINRQFLKKKKVKIIMHQPNIIKLIISQCSKYNKWAKFKSNNDIEIYVKFNK